MTPVALRKPLRGFICATCLCIQMSPRPLSCVVIHVNISYGKINSIAFLCNARIVSLMRRPLVTEPYILLLLNTVDTL